MSDLLDAFAALGNDQPLTAAHRDALLEHLKQTPPKAERKRLRNLALAECVQRMVDAGLDPYATESGELLKQESRICLMISFKWR